MTVQLLTKNDFTGAKPRRFETYPLPWDTSRGVRLRSLTEKEASEYESSLLRKRKGQVEVREEALKTARREYVALCVVNASGETIMDLDDVNSMAEGDARLFAFVYKCCQEHNHIDDDDIQRLMGNSSAARDSGLQPVSVTRPESST